MSTHAVASDADFAGIELWESSKDSLGQLLGDIAVHVIAFVVGSLGGVDVETGAGAEVIRVVLAFDVQTA